MGWRDQDKHIEKFPSLTTGQMAGKQRAVPQTSHGRMLSGIAGSLPALALCGTWQTVVKNQQLSAFVNSLGPWQENGNSSNHAQFKSLVMSGFSRTHTDIRRDSKRFADVQSAMAVMLPTWLMDQLTIKISKAIPVACWQLVQSFAPVSPALHMRLEWIILACARHSSPFLTATSSKEHPCWRPGSSLQGPTEGRSQYAFEKDPGMSGWQGYQLRVVLDSSLHWFMKSACLPHE